MRNLIIIKYMLSIFDNNNPARAQSSLKQHHRSSTVSDRDAYPSVSRRDSLRYCFSYHAGARLTARAGIIPRPREVPPHPYALHAKQSGSSRLQACGNAASSAFSAATGVALPAGTACCALCFTVNLMGSTAALERR